MIQKNNRYVITINDLTKICKYFGTNINTTEVKTHPEMGFTEHRFYDIYTEQLLFTFYDHDGMFRVPKDKVTFHEIHISGVLAKNPVEPPKGMLDAISKKRHKPASAIPRRVQKIKEKLTK